MHIPHSHLIIFKKLEPFKRLAFLTATAIKKLNRLLKRLRIISSSADSVHGRWEQVCKPHNHINQPNDCEQNHRTHMHFLRLSSGQTDIWMLSAMNGRFMIRHRLSGGFCKEGINKWWKCFKLQLCLAPKLSVWATFFLSDDGPSSYFDECSSSVGLTISRKRL